MRQRPSIRVRRLIIRMAVAGTISATVSLASALAVSTCSDFNRPACSIRLSTEITMSYREMGPRDGSPVFLLHGYTDSSRSWELVLPVLHRLLPGSDIIVPDLRGHGQTSMPSGWAARPRPRIASPGELRRTDRPRPQPSMGGPRRRRHRHRQLPGARPPDAHPLRHGLPERHPARDRRTRACGRDSRTMTLRSSVIRNAQNGARRFL